MSATMALFVFPVSISFCKNGRFLAIYFSMIEIACWSVSVTSTHSASDLLNSFAPCFLDFTVFIDTVGDMLVDLTQSDLYFDERFLARDIFSSC